MNMKFWIIALTFVLSASAAGQSVLTIEEAGHTWYVFSVAFSPDGTQLASTSRDRSIILWNVATGRQVWRLAGLRFVGSSVAFSPDGMRLATISRDNSILLLDVATGQQVRRFEGHTSTVLSVVFSPDGTQLASGSWDGMIRLWDVATGQEVQRFEGHTSRVNSWLFHRTVRGWHRGQTTIPSVCGM